jgi:hypothetical protein
MQARTLPSRQGLQWLSNSFKVYGKARVRMPLIVLSYVALGVVMLMFGGVGLLLFFLLDPIFSVGLANLSQRVDQGVGVDPGVIFTGFLRSPKTLLALGAIYVCVMFVVFVLTILLFGLIFGDASVKELAAPLLEQAEGVRRGIDPESFKSLAKLIQIALFLHIPPSVVFWHAAILIAWHGLPKGKALFFSLVGCLRNWRAFTVYAISIFISLVLIPNFLLDMLVNFEVGLKALMIVNFAFLLLVMTLWCTGIYVSHRDIFAKIDETA